MNRRPRWIALAAVSAIAIAGVIGFAWWRAHAEHAALVAALPPRPDLTGRAPDLTARIAACESQVRANENAPRALAELSQWYHGNGFLGEAAHCYAVLETSLPDEGRWPYRHAMILSSYGATDDAETLFRRTIADAPDYVPARLRLGELLLKRNARAEAEEVFATVLRLQPDEPYALLGLARCDVDAERWPAAREKLERLVTLTDYALGYDLIVPVYERLGLKERAAAIRGRIRAWGAFQDLPDPWMDELFDFSFDVYQLSLAAGNAKRRGDRQLARARLEHALALAPENGSLHFELGTLLVEIREYTSARKHLERCTALRSDFPDGWAHLSGLLATVGDAAGAARALADGLEHCPDSPGLHRMFARELKRQGRMEEAIAEFRTSIRLRPTEADGYLDLAVTLSGLGRKDESIAELERALIAEPDQPAALILLSLHAIDRGQETTARQFITRARNQPRVPADDLARIATAYQAKFGRPAP